MFSNVYIEITNICNLDCSFCHKTKRAPKTMTQEEFSSALRAVSPYAKSVFFHLMGEPTAHPLLPEFIKETNKAGIRPILTTNGTLLPKMGDSILGCGLYRVNISLHSFEANLSKDMEAYLRGCFDFASKAAAEGTFAVFRLWNSGGLEVLNSEILELCRQYFTAEWVNTKKGFRLADRIFLEWDKKFDWPDAEAPMYEGEAFCLGLREQIGILSDGRVVPCCLDSDGAITLGNIFNDKIEDIMSSERVQAMLEGFKKHIALENLCQRCSYRTKFNRL